MTQGRVACALAPGRPAEWTFVVGVGFLAAVPIDTDSAVVEMLAALVHEPDIELEALVALLPLSGTDAVPSFVVVVPGEPTDDDGIPLSAVVRGDIAADVFSVGGSRRFTDRDVRPWLLASFGAVTGLSIGAPRGEVISFTGLDGGHTIGLGAVAGNSLYWSLVGPRTQPFAHDPEPHTLDDTIIRQPIASADTILQPGRARPNGANGANSRTSADEDTVILRQPKEHEAVPVLEGQIPVPKAPARQAGSTVARYAFRLGNGPLRRLDAVYLLGRAPRPPRIVAAPPRLLTVSSPHAAVSGTHLEIRQEGDAVVVTDLGSTNGTIVIPPRGRKRRLRPEQSLVVVPGTTVDIGDGNIIEILR